MAAAEDADDLYALPLDEFTAARNDRAKQLRAEGRREEAAEIAALRKPSVAAWVVNRLAREHRDDVGALIAAASEIRSGGEDGEARFREAIDRLARAARELRVSSDRPPSDQVVQEVVTTLRTLAATEPDALLAGQLVEGREASGFDALAGSAPPPRARRSRETPRREKEERKPTVDRDTVDAARKALAAARDEARELRRAAVAAEREAERARVALQRAEARVAEAEAELDAARRPR
jgi:hypothetical protein